MFLRPTLVPGGDAARHLVRDPLTMKHLDSQGEEKPESEYWHMRILEKGVERRGEDGAWPSDAEPIQAEHSAPAPNDAAASFAANLGLPAPDREETRP